MKTTKHYTKPGEAYKVEVFSRKLCIHRSVSGSHDPMVWMGPGLLFTCCKNLWASSDLPVRCQTHILSRRAAIRFLGSSHVTHIFLLTCTRSPLSAFFPTTSLTFHFYRFIIAISPFPFYPSNQSSKPLMGTNALPSFPWRYQKHMTVSQEFWLLLLVLKQVAHFGRKCPWKERTELKWLVRVSSPYP